MTERAAKVLITCAPPNPNGDLHVGHLSGPFLGAGVLRRYLAARGHEVHYVSYTDDHSCYVERKAAELGAGSPRETSATYTRRIEQTLALADLLPDYYAHPHREPRHDRTVRHWYRRLRDGGELVERELAVPWCERCQSDRYEAYVRGRCPACGQPSDGMYCEDCGRPHEPDGLVEGTCTRCQHPTTTRPERRLVFALDRYGDRLADYHAGSDWRPRLLDYCRRMVKQGLPVVPVSRRDGYGIPVPLPGWEGHILDTWSSGIFGYVSATAAHGSTLGRPELWRELWQDPGTVTVNFIGFDCSFSHAILWPALLMALGGFTLPRHVITNEFYNLEGEKFSTSRGHAIWGADLLREVPADALRLHLCRTNPEHAQSNFSVRDLDATVNELLAGRLEAWATSLLDLLREDHASVVPTAGPAARPSLRRLIEELPAATGRHLEPGTFSLRGAAEQLTAAMAEAAGDLADLRAGRGDGDGYRAGLAAHAELLALLAAVSAPLLPAWSRHAWRQLGLEPGETGPPWPREGTRLVPAEQRVAPAFRRMFSPR